MLQIRSLSARDSQILGHGELDPGDAGQAPEQQQGQHTKVRNNPRMGMKEIQDAHF